MAKTLTSLSIFFPAYNDAPSIGKLVEESLQVASQVANKFEVIVINDGSSDNTANVLQKLSQKYPELRFINHETNRGYGGALKTGFKEAKFDYIFYTDGDGQYDVKELPLLAEKISDGVDLVNGYKIKRGDPLLRTIAGNFYSLWVRVLLGVRFADVDCDFRLFNKRTLDKINLTCDSGAICAEMLLKVQKANGVILSVPVHHFPRQFGKSQFFRFDRILKTILDDLWLWQFIK